MKHKLLNKLRLRVGTGVDVMSGREGLVVFARA